MVFGKIYCIGGTLNYQVQLSRLYNIVGYSIVRVPSSLKVFILHFCQIL